MSRADNRDTRPRAMVHRRILDVAASRPDATLSAIAGEVSGASPSLVERVLDEYGDPAGEDPDDSPGRRRVVRPTPRPTRTRRARRRVLRGTATPRPRRTTS